MISSTSNPQVKNLIQLKKKSKIRRQQKLYMVEGIRMFCEARPQQTEQIYVSESFLQTPEHSEMLRGRDFEVLTDTVFSYVSDTKTPQGILCLMKMQEADPQTILQNRNGLWLILENVQDPGNLGTMFRTGEGAGVSGVIMDKNTVDIYNPKTIRSTMGSIYRVPFVITDSIADTVKDLKQVGTQICAAHLEGSVCYDEPDYEKGTAFLIGNEGNGLTAETAALADVRIRIPMGGKLESLNAAMAAGILMYEANRQRRRGI